ncbi:hypothetical protein LJ555_11655 [Lacticaseibacillus paracasei]|uniref:hypothetical protein n=1 Tax=Lacticaseibacillus paracasei TaxID=1597 RepID=UPI0005173E37|nr:hypothetical protein [Lacticaseibacillus paracasei]MCT3362084.1 hypothetical protein [Lacticaseibacillus paracasei]UNG77807.1 hypothetical protein LJ555_11655 [Lacticaseibacillus paracasei]
MSRKIGTALIYLARIIGWAFGLIAVLAAIIAWVFAAPFATAGIALMGEPTSLNLSGLKELVVETWENFD